MCDPARTRAGSLRWNDSMQTRGRNQLENCRGRGYVHQIWLLLCLTLTGLPGKEGEMPARSCFSGRFPLGMTGGEPAGEPLPADPRDRRAEDVPLAEVCPLAAPVGPRWRRPAGSSRVPGRRGGGSPGPAPSRVRHVGPPGKQAAQQPAPAPEPHQAGPPFLHRRGTEPGGLFGKRWWAVRVRGGQVLLGSPPPRPAHPPCVVVLSFSSSTTTTSPMWRFSPSSRTSPVRSWPNWWCSWRR